MDLNNIRDRLKSVIVNLDWAKDTIDSKLKFGLPEEHAIKRREARVSGVLLTEVAELKLLVKDIDSPDQSSGEK